ncbi:MAG: hypothetical protein IT236_07305 [Bacteroidia bacterium]|nr:hypothetical protein [Bacteroidia bacterium]
MKWTKVYVFLIIVFGLSHHAHSQSHGLENNLKKYFYGIPVLESADSIFRFIKSDTLSYSIGGYLYADTVKSDYDYHVYFKQVKAHPDFFYRRRIPYFVSDTTTCSFLMGISGGGPNVFATKLRYKRLKREFSKYFSKSTSKKYRDRLMGGRSGVTIFYLNKTDVYPFMKLYWTSGSCLNRQHYGILLYRKIKP